MKLFLFNGDSNVAGCELENPTEESMAAVISKHYNAKNINLSVDGSSNDRIYETTIEYLKNNPSPDFVMIGWSDMGREQWYLNGEMHEVNHLDVGKRIPEEYRRRYQFWKHNIRVNADWHRVMGFYWHNKIYNLHMILREKNIPHYFFNAFHAFNIPKEQYLDWHGSFYRPYWQNCTYINWCIEHDYKEITPDWLHFNADAHQAWAEELIKTMAEDNIL